MPGGIYLQAGADARIAVAQFLERLAVDGPGDCRRGRRGVVPLLEKVRPGSLGIERRAVEQGAQRGVLAAVGQNIEMLFRAVEFAGEAQQLKQKGPAPRIAGNFAEFGAERLDGVGKFAGLKQFLRIHVGTAWSENKNRPAPAGKGRKRRPSQQHK